METSLTSRPARSLLSIRARAGGTQQATSFSGWELRFSPKLSSNYPKIRWGVTGRVNSVGDKLIVSATATRNYDISLTRAVVCFVAFQNATRIPRGKYKMAKFYVQSGSIRGIVDCYDSECAAVWAVNRVMLQIDPMAVTALEEEGGQTDIGMFALDDSIQISEQGFDRDDCEQFDTHMAFVQWHQLKKAIDALQQQMNDKLE